MLRVRTPLGALGRLCCKVVVSTEKTEVLLDGSVARLSHRQRRQGCSWTALLQDCRINREDRGALGRLCCKIVASTEKKLGCHIDGEDNWSINYSRYPAFHLGVFVQAAK